jgi:lysophospholipase L1-like esterase
MKTILCYGDSLTWGYNPADATRLLYEQRWPGILAEALAGRARIVEEALNSRTIATDDPTRPGRNGLVMLAPLLESHAPVDIVVIMLGTNDCAPALRLNAGAIGRGSAALIRATKRSLAGPDTGAPKIVMVAPPVFGALSPAMQVFYGGGEALSRELASVFRTLAEYYGCLFLDAGKVVTASAIDGIHLDPPEQRKLAMAICDFLVPLL